MPPPRRHHNHIYDDLEIELEDFVDEEFLEDDTGESDSDEDEDDEEEEDAEEEVGVLNTHSLPAAPIVFEVPDSDTATASSSQNAAADGEAVREEEELEVVEEEDTWNREDVDGLFCPICMEPWCSSGEHQPSCLSCGHMFGMSCIKKWLGQSRSRGKCPQCNKKCTLKDIRRLYGSRVVVVDEESQKRIRFLEAKCNSLEEKDEGWRKKEVEWRMKVLIWQKKEADWRHIFDQLNERTSNLERLVEDFEKNGLCPMGAARWNSGHKSVLASSFGLQQEVQLDGARFFDMDHTGQVLVIARRSTQIGGPHLLTKMSLVSPCEQDDVVLPSTVKAVRDVHVSFAGGLALLASIGKKLSVVSLQSNNVVIDYDLPVAAWSCSWDINSSNYAYAGLQNGMVLVFDLRQTARPLESKIGPTSNPVHTIYPLSEDLASPSGTKSLLTASSVGLCQWNVGAVHEQPTLIKETTLTDVGVCISLAYCHKSDNVVATYRPKVETQTPDDPGLSQVSQTQSHNIAHSVLGSHVLFKRHNSSYQKLGSRCANVPGIRLPKSSILAMGKETSLFSCGDDSTSNLTLQELPSLTVAHCLQSNFPVRDVKYCTSSNPNLLCCLSEGRVQLFSQKLT